MSRRWLLLLLALAPGTAGARKARFPRTLSIRQPNIEKLERELFRTTADQLFVVTCIDPRLNKTIRAIDGAFQISGAGPLNGGALAEEISVVLGNGKSAILVCGHADCRAMRAVDANIPSKTQKAWASVDDLGVANVRSLASDLAQNLKPLLKKGAEIAIVPGFVRPTPKTKRFSRLEVFEPLFVTR